jgi:hypothetical protein
MEEPQPALPFETLIAALKKLQLTDVEHAQLVQLVAEKVPILVVLRVKVDTRSHGHWFFVCLPYPFYECIVDGNADDWCVVKVGKTNKSLSQRVVKDEGAKFRTAMIQPRIPGALDTKQKDWKVGDEEFVEKARAKNKELHDICFLEKGSCSEDQVT